MFSFQIVGIPIAVTNADEVQAPEVFDSEELAGPDGNGQ
jgi:hypothetical protein